MPIGQNSAAQSLSPIQLHAPTPWPDGVVHHDSRRFLTFLSSGGTSLELRENTLMQLDAIGLWGGIVGNLSHAFVRK